MDRATLYWLDGICETQTNRIETIVVVTTDFFLFRKHKQTLPTNSFPSLEPT